jgi:hypothetical protein
VIYLSAGNRINELVYSDHWYHHDLTSEAKLPTPAPVAASGSALAGYVTTFNEQQHVIFLGTDQHVHELVYGGHQWSHNDLTIQASWQTTASVAASGSALAGYVTTFNEQQHVLFIAADNHVHQLVYDTASGHWYNDDPSSAAAAMDVAAGTALAGFQTADNQQQHVIYVATDKHVHELVYADPKWYTDDLTWRAHTDDPTGGTYHGSATVGSLVGFPLYGHDQCLLYVGADGHVHELGYLAKPNKWSSNDVTNGCSAATPVSGSPLAAYLTTYEGGEYVYAVFLGPYNYVHQLDISASASHNLSLEYY